MTRRERYKFTTAYERKQEHELAELRKERIAEEKKAKKEQEIEAKQKKLARQIKAERNRIDKAEKEQKESKRYTSRRGKTITWFKHAKSELQRLNKELQKYNREPVKHRRKSSVHHKTAKRKKRRPERHDSDSIGF